MRTKEFNKIKPYTYLIIRKSDNMKYHGVRYGNVKLGLSPKEDFGKRYFGSSAGSFCKEFRFNSKEFKFKLAWTFDEINEATTYEKKLIKKYTNDQIGKIKMLFQRFFIKCILC